MTNLEKTIQDIKSEVKVAADGSATISKRGLARLLDVSYSTVTQSAFPKKLAEKLATYGFDPSRLSKEIPDTAIPVFAQYYASEAQVKSTQAAQLLLAFSAIGARTWMQQVAGYQAPPVPKLSDIENMKVANKALSQMISIYEYADNKPGLQRMVDHAVGASDQLALEGIVTLDDILARTGREYSNEEKQVIGRYAGMSYRSLTGKAPEQVKVCRKDRSGRKQYYSVAAYRHEFVPVIENAIELGFGS